MNVLYLLVPLAILLAGAGAAAFWWAVRTGQFDDVETPAIRILLDEEEPDTTRRPRPDVYTPEHEHHANVTSRR